MGVGGGGFLTDLPTRAWPQYPGILLTLSLCTQAVSGAQASHPKGAKSNKREGGSKATRHQGSCENKTDPLGGSGKHTHTKKIWEGGGGGGGKRNQGRTTFVEMFSCHCSQCAVLIIPLSPRGGWRTHSDILVNILGSKRTSLAGAGQT